MATPMGMVTDRIESMYHREKWSLVLRGLVSLAFGVLILARPLAGVAAFALVIALWALVDGITGIVHAFDLRPISSHWWVLLLSGLVSTIFGGAALYYYPALSLSFAVVWVSLWLVVSGVLGVFLAVQERRVGMSWGWTLVLGILAIAAGVFAFMYPGITLASLIGIIGGFAIVIGIAMLVGATRMQSFEQRVHQALGTPARA